MENPAGGAPRSPAGAGSDSPAAGHGSGQGATAGLRAVELVSRELGLAPLAAAAGPPDPVEAAPDPEDGLPQAETAGAAPQATLPALQCARARVEEVQATGELNPVAAAAITTTMAELTHAQQLLQQPDRGEAAAALGRCLDPLGDLQREVRGRRAKAKAREAAQLARLAINILNGESKQLHFPPVLSFDQQHIRFSGGCTNSPSLLRTCRSVG